MRTLALLFALLLGGWTNGVRAGEPGAPPLLECDRIFAEWYCGFFFYSPADPVLKRLGELPAQLEPSDALKSVASQRERVRALPLDQQARLVLLVSLSIPLDGEKAAFFWSDLFGDGAPEIGRRLRAVDQKEIERICQWMRVPLTRAQSFRRHIDQWGDRNFKPKKID